MDYGATPDIVIAPVDKKHLADCEQLAKEGFSFEDRQVIPSWYIHTVNCYGGLTLGAFLHNELVAYSYAFPAFTGDEPFLFSCGLVVKGKLRSKGIAYQLKLAQRDHALRRGYRLIKWTTGSMASGPLYLYLTKLRAQLVAIRRQMLDGVMPNVVADEVEIDWWLDTQDAGRSASPQADTPDRSQVPRLAVEIPWDVRMLSKQEPELVRDWRVAVRDTVETMLARGYVGVEVQLDRPENRSYIQFQPSEPNGGRPALQRAATSTAEKYSPDRDAVGAAATSRSPT